MEYASAKGTCQVKRSPPKYDEVDKTSHLAVNLAYEQFNSTCKYYRSCKGLRKRCYLIIAACKKTTARLNSGTHAKVYLNAHHNEQYRTRANGEREWFMVATRRTGLTVCYASFNCCIYRIGCAYYFDYRFSAAKSHNILKSYFTFSVIVLAKKSNWSRPTDKCPSYSVLWRMKKQKNSYKYMLRCE